MAAAMGFSSFGSHKPAAKKRKFNPATDAYVEGDELAGLDKGGKKGQGSGGNTMPLGKARVFGSAKGADERTREAPTGGNENEISLDDEDDDDEGPRYIDTSTAPPIEATGSYIQRHAPSDPPPQPGVSEQEAREVQARIDALLSSLGGGAPGTEHAAQALPHNLPPKPTFTNTAFMLGGPPPPFQPGSRGGGFNDASSVASSSRPSERGQKNPTWYVGYYDPSFNDNPWAKLEQARGLEPRGPWLDSQAARAGRA